MKEDIEAPTPKKIFCGSNKSLEKLETVIDDVLLSLPPFSISPINDVLIKSILLSFNVDPSPL